MTKQWYTYILTNHTNSVLYVGVTNDLTRRQYEHKTGTNQSSFSKKYKLHKVVWCEQFATPGEAIVAEKKIKGWKRDKKIYLIEQSNPEWHDLLV